MLYSALRSAPELGECHSAKGHVSFRKKLRTGISFVVQLRLRRTALVSGIVTLTYATACSVSLENPNNRARGFVVSNLHLSSPAFAWRDVVWRDAVPGVASPILFLRSSLGVSGWGTYGIAVMRQLSGRSANRNASEGGPFVAGAEYCGSCEAEEYTAT